MENPPLASLLDFLEVKSQCLYILSHGWSGFLLLQQKAFLLGGNHAP